MATAAILSLAGDPWHAQAGHPSVGDARSADRQIIFLFNPVYKIRRRNNIIRTYSANISIPYSFSFFLTPLNVEEVKESKAG